MPTIIECPSCNRKLRLPDELAGKAVRCPTCGQTFSGESPAPPPRSPADLLPSSAPTAALPQQPPPIPQQAPPLPPGPPPAGTPLRTCPYCREAIAEHAQFCPHCGESLNRPGDPQAAWERGQVGFRRDWEPHRGPLILTFGILGITIFAPLGIVAWVLGHQDLARMKRGEMDPSGESTTMAGMVCGIIGTVLWGLGLLCCCGFYGSIFMAALSAGP
jgi:hypothetical protein